MMTSLKRGVLWPSTPTFDYLPWQITHSFRQLRQGVNSLAQWLEHWIFNREDQVRIPQEAGNFFSYALFLCYFHVVRAFKNFDGPSETFVGPLGKFKPKK